MSIDSPHLAALALGIRAVERRDEFEAAAARLFRARDETERELRRIEAARRQGRGEA